MIDDPLNRLKVKRGSELPHAKLDEAKIEYIHSVVAKRNALRATLAKMTNKALAQELDVHERTVDKVVAGYSWGHV